MSLLETAAHLRGANREEAQARHEDFVPAPNSWYYLGHVSEISRKPVRFELPNAQAFVAFRTASGKYGVLSARCCHMGTDLSRGCVIGERLACPLHGWEYGVGGQCERIPIQQEIPAFAQQTSYPVEERRGHLFFYNQPEARFPLPFFDGMTPDQLVPARAFTLEADVPWYFVGANGFDVQHFLCAHDRVMLDEPVIDSPHHFAQRIKVQFGVAGHTLTDRITRAFAGSAVTMTITVWCGTMVLVEARFQHTVTYGMMTVRPMPNGRTLARVIVWVRRSQISAARAVFDPLNARIRRQFIEIFLTSDIERMAGVRHNPHRLLDIDAPFARHLDWLKGIQL
jgi:nitrite reductase/ring-hydroxylating ferredoxin subunit